MHVGVSVSYYTPLLYCFTLSIQLVTIALSTLLFIKYIFFDKSEVFTTSVPPTPSLAQNSSRTINKASPPAASITDSASCPFALSHVSNGSITRRRTAPGLRMNIDLPKPVRRHCPLEGMEKVQNGGMVIRNSGRTNTTHRPALEDNVQNTSHQEDTECGIVGHMVKIEDKVSRTEMLPCKPTFVSVGVQTEPIVDDTDTTSSRTPRQSMFSIGGASCDSRKASVVSSLDSGIEGASLDLDTRNGGLPQTTDEPRPVVECLNIFKSDVSWLAILHNCVIGFEKRGNLPYT